MTPPETMERKTDPDDLSPLAGVKARVCRCLGGRIDDFDVVFQGAGLVLRGRARSQHVKQLAEQRVMDEIELPILANRIEVGVIHRPVSSLRVIGANDDVSMSRSPDHDLGICANQT